jgi:hypothetical protein
MINSIRASAEVPTTGTILAIGLTISRPVRVRAKAMLDWLIRAEVVRGLMSMKRQRLGE